MMGLWEDGRFGHVVRLGVSGASDMTFGFEGQMAIMNMPTSA